jgi:hypothetical protein
MASIIELLLFDVFKLNFENNITDLIGNKSEFSFYNELLKFLIFYQSKDNEQIG